LVGRGEELAFVRAALDDRGCVVAGVAGVGKSRLAKEAVGDRPAIEVLATQSASAVPYGAFAHLFRPGAPGPTDVIPSFIQRLNDEYRGTAPVALVDDGHLLDRASAALVLALATTGSARPLVTVRTPEPVPDAPPVLTCLLRPGRALLAAHLAVVDESGGDGSVSIRCPGRAPS